MNRTFVTLLMAVCIVFSANAQKGNTSKPKPFKLKLNVEQTTASGLKVKLIQQGKGTQAVSGNTVSVHYVGTLLDGKKFDSSRDRGQPIKFKLGQGRVIKGWDEGIALLKVGDKALFTIPPALGYGAQEVGGGLIPANSTLVFEVELMEVLEGPKPFDLKGKDTLTTASGLKYIIAHKAEASALKADSGKNVSVHYTGMLMDGKVFDSSVERGSPITFQVGQGNMIKGWDEGVALMHVGDKFRFIIPAELAYGANGAGGIIPPNATLIFDIELMGIQ